MTLRPPFSNASRSLGAFLLLPAAALFFLSSCKKDQNSEWTGPTLADEAELRETTLAKPSHTPDLSASPATHPHSTTEPSLRFIAYNVENWLTMDRYINGERQKSKGKPEEETEAATRLLSRYQPDVLGICEIGTAEDLKDLQSRLKDAGLDLPHSHHTGGFDPTRRLALLSRLPITSVERHEELEYTLEAKTRGMGRGIIDATVETRLGPVRFLGVHLKSKREIPEADQEMMRRAEAHLVRAHADHILTAEPDAKLIVYGDFNDSRQSSSVRTLRGPGKGPLSLKMTYLKDSRGETWTHFWSYQDIYSRFDYVLFSEPLLDLADFESCRILDDPEVMEASDHRPLLFVLE
ncbi:MAG: endonuclease/exonuclease/phosphatase family protein [Verrucomicrobiales bacterium]